MPTGPDRIAVLALQLARDDRRALSQAWYDALHVARCEPRSPVTRAQRPAEAATLERPAPAHRRAGVAPRGVTGTPKHQAPEPPAVATRPADAASARVARAALRLATTTRPFAQTIALGTGRVQLLVRSDAAGTRVVAICAAADRERVARALAEVRVALAGAGITVAA
jgi:hypothetical protein